MKKTSAIAMTLFFAGAMFVFTLNAADEQAITGSQALKMLKIGNERFIKKETICQDRNVGQRIQETAKGQKPFAIVLSCSDSRVPVEEIFDYGIGDIFVVRVAGNIAMDKGVIGSIEYAVKHLNVPLLVVMGHTDCGAVKAAIYGAPLEGDLRDIQKKIEPVAAKIRADNPELKGSALDNAVIKANAMQAKSDLLSGSKDIKDASSDGSLMIVTALYDVGTGAVSWGGFAKGDGGGDNMLKQTMLQQVFEEAKMENGVKQLSYNQFIKVRKSGEKYTLFDVLPPDSYAKGHIEGAVSFPGNTINKDSAAKILSKDSKIIVYCGSFQCPASTEAAKKLSDLGYNVLDYKGGLKEWQEKGNKLVK